ncbi:MAG TPA: RNA polymerase sigma factor [Thermoanaerobaculia bacterium]|nr:RNA polymerase sigma factor [Thermoanaerobaculia bacterium]
MIERMNVPLVIREMTTARSRDVDRALALMGEEDFRAFYERTARPLWAYLSRITGDRQQADDLLQESYYRFFRGGDRHENEAHRRNSLFQIATNLARDAARRHRHHAEVPLPDDETQTAPPPVSSAPTPERQAAIRTDLARAFEQLDPIQRELLWLAYAQGASHEEIGEIVGVRAISVRTLLLRARRRVARILEGGAR